MSSDNGEKYKEEIFVCLLKAGIILALFIGYALACYLVILILRTFGVPI